MKQRLIVIIGILICGCSSLAQPAEDHSLKELLHSISLAQIDTVKIDLLNEIAFKYSDSDPVEGIRYGQQAISMALSAGDKHRLAEAYSITGTNYSSVADYAHALENHFKSLTIREALGEKNNIAVCLNNIGIIYDTQRQYPKALDYYQRARETFDKLGYKKGVATVSANIGLVQTALTHYDKALENLHKALAIIMEEGDSASLASCVNNIGTVYLYRKMYAEALDYYLRGLKLNESFGNRLGEGISRCNLGEVYYFIASDTDKTLLNKLFNGQKNVPLQKASENLQKAETVFQSMGAGNGLAEVYDYLSRTRQEQGDNKEALQLYKQHIAYRDSVYSEEEKSNIQRVEKARTEDLKQKEIEIQKLQLEKAKNERNYFMAGIVLLALLLVLLYNRFRLKKKSNEKIHAAYEDLKKTQLQLIQSEKMASLGQLSVGIAHEIQNPLNFVKNFAEISEELVGELNQAQTHQEREEAGKYLKINLGKITEHANRVGSIIKGMLLELHPNSSERVPTDINKLCNDFSDTCYKAMIGKHPGFSCKLSKSWDATMPEINVSPQDISRLVLNITQNAFHAVFDKQKLLQGTESFKPEVILSTRFVPSGTKHQTPFFEMAFSDNGSGIAEANKRKIFDPFYTTRSQQGGVGLGLSICYDIVKTYAGEIKVESVEGEFTKVLVTIPV